MELYVNRGRLFLSLLCQRRIAYPASQGSRTIILLVIRMIPMIHRLFHLPIVYLDTLFAWILMEIDMFSLGLQFDTHELPCPLCLLQRMGSLLIVLSLALTL